MSSFGIVKSEKTAHIVRLHATWFVIFIFHYVSILSPLNPLWKQELLNECGLTPCKAAARELQISEEIEVKKTVGVDKQLVLTLLH